MIFVFSMFFFAVWPGGRRCANCRDALFFLRGTVMKASSHEKHAKQQWKKQHKIPKKKQKVQTHGQGLGRGLAGDMGLNFFFCFSMVFCSLAKTSRKPTKNKKNKPMGKVWAIV